MATPILEPAFEYESRCPGENTPAQEHSVRSPEGSISEQNNIQNRLPTLPDDSTPSQTNVISRGLQSQCSPSPDRPPSRHSMRPNPAFPVYIPTVMSSRQDPSTRLADYYEDKFAVRDSGVNARNRVLSMAPVMAELRTNVLIKDEYSLITGFSNELSGRYTRPESSIFIHLDHSACVVMGGSFDPAYILTISTCSSSLQPILNRRNAALLQRFLFDSMGVPPHRGIVRFNSIPEDSLATDGRTILGDINDAEGTNVIPTIATKSSFFRLNKGKTRSRHSLSQQSQKSASAIDSAISIPAPRTPPSTTHIPAAPTTQVTTLVVPDRKTNSYADSGVGTISDGRSPLDTSNEESGLIFPPLPPIPVEPELYQPKLGKRKSLMNMLRKSRAKTITAV